MSGMCDQDLGRASAAFIPTVNKCQSRESRLSGYLVNVAARISQEVYDYFDSMDFNKLKEKLSK